MQTTHEPPKTSINWANYSRPVHTVTGLAAQSPFILDSGATCHISPESSDFITFDPIPPEPIEGFGGTSILAIGKGTIELSVSLGRPLYLRDALFVPGSTLRLISVSSLNRDNGCKTLFGTDSCEIIDQSETIIARGVLSRLSPTHNLYTLTTPTPRVTHRSTMNTQGAVTHSTESSSRRAPQAYPTAAAPTAPACRYPNCHRRVNRDERTQELTEYCSLDHMRDDLRLGAPPCPACNERPRRINGYYCGPSCEKWDVERQQQPQRHQQYYPPSGVRPQSVSSPRGNVNWGIATVESFPTSSLSLGHLPVEGLVLCPKCGSKYLARSGSWPRYETGREDSVGYMSLPPCPTCGYSR